MKYKYGNIENVKPGDVVECTKWAGKLRTSGKLYVVDKSILADIPVLGSIWKLVLTKPGSEAKVGDKCIFVTDDIGGCKKGNLYYKR